MGGATVGRRAIKGVRTIPSEDENLVRANEMLALVRNSLENDKAIDPVTIDLRGKTTIADYMVVATGTSERHIVTMAEKLAERLGEVGIHQVAVEGLAEARWVLLDAGDVIVHLFRAETRELYDIERLWSVAPPGRIRAAAGG